MKRSGTTASTAQDNVNHYLVSVSEIAELTGVSLKTVRRWDGLRLIPGRVELPGSRLVRFRRQAVLDWIDRGCPSR